MGPYNHRPLLVSTPDTRAGFGPRSPDKSNAFATEFITDQQPFEPGWRPSWV
jgi:hypothetical protein